MDEVLNEPLFHIFEARPPVIDRGECSILFWEIFPQAGKLPKLDGMEVPFQGEIEVCPQLTTPYVLASDFMPELFAIVEVIGEGDDSSDPPATLDPNITPTITLTPDPASTTTPTQEPGSVTPTNTPVSGPTNTPTADTTPPAISNASVSPSDFIYTTNDSCSPTAFNISVKVTDAGGVSSVSLNWTGSGVRSGPESMYYSAGKYVKNLGLFINPGSLSNFSITATDTAGNTSTLSLGWNLDVELCGGS